MLWWNVLLWNSLWTSCYSGNGFFVVISTYHRSHYGCYSNPAAASVSSTVDPSLVRHSRFIHHLLCATGIFHTRRTVSRPRVIRRCVRLVQRLFDDVVSVVLSTGISVRRKDYQVCGLFTSLKVNKIISQPDELSVIRLSVYTTLSV